jgi:hypothetical protein
VTSLQQAKTEINRPREWSEWSVSEAHQWLRAQLNLPTHRDRCSTFGFFSDLLRVWDAPRPEFWPTLTWDRQSLSAELDEEALAKLPAILHEAEGTPEYPKLWWAWRTLGLALDGLSRRRPRLEGWRDGTSTSPSCQQRNHRQAGGDPEHANNAPRST